MAEASHEGSCEPESALTSDHQLVPCRLPPRVAVYDTHGQRYDTHGPRYDMQGPSGGVCSQSTGGTGRMRHLDSGAAPRDILPDKHLVHHLQVRAWRAAKGQDTRLKPTLRDSVVACSYTASPRICALRKQPGAAAPGSALQIRLARPEVRSFHCAAKDARSTAGVRDAARQPTVSDRAACANVGFPARRAPQ